MNTDFEVKQLTPDKFIVYGDKDRKPLIRMSRTIRAAGFYANVERLHVTKKYFLSIDLTRKAEYHREALIAIKPIV